MKLPKTVKIVEVGPRDGLQNEKVLIDTATKVQLIQMLADAGVSYIEAGSFVSPKWVPQMADSAEVFQLITPTNKVTYAALTPNIKGLERAIDCGVKEVAVFASASEGFSQKNINCSIAESLLRFQPVVRQARQQGLPVRAYISCVVDCPYDGAVKPSAVTALASELLTMGCYEISLGDTIGTGTQESIKLLLENLLTQFSAHRLAVHFHDTYRRALANIYTALQMGISVIDSSVAGLGGCPYAKTASGNVATEEVILMLNSLGIEHGIDLNKLKNAGKFITHALGRKNVPPLTNPIPE